MSAPQGYRSIVELAREMGVELGKEQAWSIGGCVSAQFEADYGHLPMKELRPKTNGPGSHCFAVYPAPYHDRIRSMIRAANAVAVRQGALL